VVRLPGLRARGARQRCRGRETCRVAERIRLPRCLDRRRARAVVVVAGGEAGLGEARQQIQAHRRRRRAAASDLECLLEAPCRVLVTQHAERARAGARQSRHRTRRLRQR